MYELFIANKNYSSWSLRPWVLMKTLGIPFVEHLARFAPGSSFAAFRSFSPTGKVPCLRDGELVVWDSLGIAGYLAERHAGLWPEDLAARTWARCATAEMHSGFTALRNHCGMSLGVRVRLHEWPAALQADVRRIDELWSEGLGRFGGPYLAGARFGIVDAFYCPVAYRVRTYEIPLGQAALSYARRLLELPAMREWEAAGLAEPWRDEAHEQEIAQYGEVVADLRAPGGGARMTEDRVERLEFKVAHLEKAVQDLSDVVYRQQRELDAVRERGRELAEQVQGLEDRGADPGRVEIPPHY